MGRGLNVYYESYQPSEVGRGAWMQSIFFMLGLAIVLADAGTNSQYWTLSTADTEIRISISDHRPTISRLASTQEEHNWATTPTSVPLMADVWIEDRQVPLPGRSSKAGWMRSHGVSRSRLPIGIPSSCCDPFGVPGPPRAGGTLDGDRERLGPSGDGVAPGQPLSARPSPGRVGRAVVGQARWRQRNDARRDVHDAVDRGTGPRPAHFTQQRRRPGALVSRSSGQETWPVRGLGVLGRRSRPCTGQEWRCDACCRRWQPAGVQDRR